MAKVLIQNDEQTIGVVFEDVGSGPPLVLLHGFPFNRSLWSGQIDALKNDCRVIAPDLRGHGETEVTHGTVTMETMAQDVAHLLDYLQIEKVTVGGLSMGGYVTLAFARLFPDRVQALILADTRAQADTEDAKQNRKVQSEKALAEGMKPIAEGMLPKLVTPNTMANRPEVVNLVQEMMLNTPAKGAAAALLGMGGRQDHREFLAEIKVPTLIIVGREDPITPLADSELMHQKIAGSRLEVIDDASHVSNLEQAEHFNRALLSFIKKG